ncbi:MAG: ribonuclease III [Candidatus Berkelbacteria bacterium]|nr:ribonuclease III [Candidatus Berkelbacteria bacterium]
MMLENISEFAKKNNLKFNDEKLLENVFIHRSYLNEHRGLGLEQNERLEFLGDAVLELAVTEYLFTKFNRPEGEMTSWRSALVKGESLSEEAKNIGMDEYICVSRGEAKNVGKARDLILANAFEALIGAIYLDLGFDTAKKFIEEHISYKLENIISGENHIDAKSRFQELVQEKFSITPSYETISESGPDHNKKFVVAILIGEQKIAEGEGNSKQRAQIAAAAKALENKELI